MLLVIDIGNTNITLAIFKKDKIISTFRLTTNSQRTSDEYGSFILTFIQSSGIKSEDIEDIIISTVVPKIMYSFNNAIYKYLKKEPIIIGPGIKTGISLKIENPKSLGGDRLVDAVGAYNLYGGPCIAIDFGTATTFDIVDENGTFIGGATAPGIGISTNALSNMAAQLPEISIRKPKSIIGKNTISSMQAGVVYGYIGLTEKIITELKKEYGSDLKVISTGGLGKIISNETDLIDTYDQELTFKGLKIIYDLNK